MHQSGTRGGALVGLARVCHAAVPCSSTECPAHLGGHLVHDAPMRLVQQHGERGSTGAQHAARHEGSSRSRAGSWHSRVCVLCPRAKQALKQQQHGAEGRQSQPGACRSSRDLSGTAFYIAPQPSGDHSRHPRAAQRRQHGGGRSGRRAEGALGRLPQQRWRRRLALPQGRRCQLRPG